jgi:hypothetical protein
MLRWGFNTLKSTVFYHPSAPTVSDDLSVGYLPGTLWVNTSTTPGTIYMCADNSVGAASWGQVGGGGGGGSIGGSISANQVAFGVSTDTITGTSNLTYTDGGALQLAGSMTALSLHDRDGRSPGWSLYGNGGTLNFVAGSTTQVTIAGSGNTVVQGSLQTIGQVLTPASTSLTASLNIPFGTAPSIPNNGDVWMTTAGLFYNYGSGVVGPLMGGLGGSAATNQVAYGSGPDILTGSSALTFDGTALTLNGTGRYLQFTGGAYILVSTVGPNNLFFGNGVGSGNSNLELQINPGVSVTFQAQQEGTSYLPISFNGAGGDVHFVSTGYRALFPAASAAAAALNIAEGTAPSTPSDGDIWMTTSGLYYQHASTVVGPLGAGPIVFPNATVTASTPLISVSQTWNNGSVNFETVIIDVTNTASAAGSKILDVQVGGSSTFSVQPGGTVFNGGSVQINSGYLQFIAANHAFLYSDVGNPLYIGNGVTTGGTCIFLDVTAGVSAAFQAQQVGVSYLPFYFNPYGADVDFCNGVLHVGASGASTMAGGTVTASTPPLTITQIWNSASVAFQGLVINITDTASATTGTAWLSLQSAGSAILNFSDKVAPNNGTTGSIYVAGNALYIEAPGGSSLFLNTNYNSDIWTGGGILHVDGTLAVATASAVIGNTVLANAATDGFLYIPSVAGAPTGTPTTHGATVALCYDTTDNKLYAYNGAWKSVVLS